jgi:hypothetical protein
VQVTVIRGWAASQAREAWLEPLSCPARTQNAQALGDHGATTATRRPAGPMPRPPGPRAGRWAVGLRPPGPALPGQLKNLIEGTAGHHASTAFPGLQEVTIRWRGSDGYLTARAGEGDDDDEQIPLYQQ